MTTNYVLSQPFFEPYYIMLCVMCIQPFIFYTLSSMKTRKRGKLKHISLSLGLNAYTELRGSIVDILRMRHVLH